MKKLYYLMLGGLIMLSTDVIGQDIHFSQFYMSPLTLNPALTGVMNCNTRFVGNYRNQWSPVIRGMRTIPILCPMIKKCRLAGMTILVLE